MFLFSLKSLILKFDLSKNDQEIKWKSTNLYDIKAIIAQSKNKAIRAIDHQPTLMYRHTGNIFLKKNRKEKTERIKKLPYKIEMKTTEAPLMKEEKRALRKALISRIALLFCGILPVIVFSFYILYLAMTSFVEGSHDMFSYVVPVLFVLFYLGAYQFILPQYKTRTFLNTGKPVPSRL